MNITEDNGSSEGSEPKKVVVEFKRADGKDISVKEETYLAASQWLERQNKDVDVEVELEVDDFDDDSILDEVFNKSTTTIAEDTENDRPSSAISLPVSNPEIKTPTFPGRNTFRRSLPASIASPYTPITPSSTSSYDYFLQTPTVKYKNNPRANKKFTPLTMTDEQRAALRQRKLELTADRKRKNTEDLGLLLVQNSLPSTPVTPSTPQLTEEQRRKIRENQAAAIKRRSLALANQTSKEVR